MSEERPFSNCDFCPECGQNCCTCPDSNDFDFPHKKKFPKTHKDFAKCNLCNCVADGDLVTITTTGGFTITGEVAEVLCECTVLRLAPGAVILPPGAATPLPETTQPIFVCCNDIETLVKEELVLGLVE